MADGRSNVFFCGEDGGHIRIDMEARQRAKDIVRQSLKREGWLIGKDVTPMMWSDWVDAVERVVLRQRAIARMVERRRFKMTVRSPTSPRARPEKRGDDG